jgi:hypothetical protein
MIIAALALAVGATFTAVPTANAADKACVPIGGEALGQFCNEGKDVTGAMMGTWTSTRGTVKSEKRTATGISLEMEHVFSTNTGGVVRTRDIAEMTAVPGKKDSYMLEVTYTVVEALGAFKGYTGTFNSFGLIKTNTGQALVRYEGEICK